MQLLLLVMLHQRKEIERKDDDMKIFHIADTHLGYSAYRKIAEDGVNQREKDVYTVFQQFIDYALEHKPDLILHAGDLFDSVRPTNRAITFALQQILRLSTQKIPFVVIAGNHEHPRLRETGHIFSIFDHIDHVYPIYKERYETVSFTVDSKKIVIHALPQCPSEKECKRNMQKMKPDTAADYNILLTHGCVRGIQAFSMNEFNEMMIPVHTLQSEFDYIALGHYHEYTHLQGNTFYAGSPERFSFAEAGGQKGFIEITLGGKFHHTFIPLQTRAMIDTQPIQCDQLSLSDIMKKIRGIMTSINSDGTIVRMNLNAIPAHLYRGLDFQRIRELSKNILHFELKATVLKDEKTSVLGTTKIGALAHEFREYLAGQSLQEQKVLLKLGMDYIEKIEGREEGK